ncbi:DUF3050 domain-containing protein [Olivibacter sp. SDN3]|nr:DUF3050 domain-containing protein [Olivibacter sp. SDN3]QNL52566.1 DUF3050 domain-containing protein [Olivibacter sp. SDN3]
MQETQLLKLELAIRPYKEQIVNHPLYKAIKSIDDLNIFMEYHIYAVWDFMSLLKALQRNLTCVDLPWFPTGDADTRYLINEIVTGEESDIDHKGRRKSHYELYLEAMEQSGADRKGMLALAQQLKAGKNLEEALEDKQIPNAANLFIKHTFDTIRSSKTHVQSAVFTFSREDLIPDMFIAIINDLNAQFPKSISIFKYYLERHIEVDGDHHSNLALEMTSKLCGDSDAKWDEAITGVKEALSVRIRLWDDALEDILAKRTVEI